MLRMLLDDTVIIEYVGERQPYCACWDKINALQLTGAAELWSTPEAYRAMSARLRDALDDDVAGEALAETLSFVNVCSTDARDVSFALEHNAHYDDALRDACARKIKADYIVTRRGGASFSSKARICTPEGMFEHLGRTQGITFDLVDF